tara:strand:+ start:7131 stop:7559 length:429 start_codon:yes stop_codon:yes gene_type:complete
MILDNEVTIAGETVRKERYGMASIHDENKTFTGDVLFTDQLRADPNGNIWDKSIEMKFQDTAQVDGLTVWKSNGEVPFADMLLDFVQIGAITLEQAEFSLIQKNKDQEKSLSTLYRADDGNIYLGEGALDYRQERLAKIEAA